MESNKIAARHNINPQQAKTMAQSYQAATNDPNSIRILTFDADELRDYLADPSIKCVAVFLAHTEDWTQNHFGVANSAQITTIIAGTDAAGNGIPNASNCVLDYADMCPSNCTNSGNANFWDNI